MSVLTEEEKHFVDYMRDGLTWPTRYYRVFEVRQLLAIIRKLSLAERAHRRNPETE
jgi:hypothetical protein